MTHNALIIDDEADIRELIALSLDRIGLDTHTAANLAEARNLLEAYTFSVCLTDMKLPDGNGVDFLKYIQSVQPELPVAVITAHGNMGAAVVAMKNGAFDFVSKPVDMNLLRKLVAQAIKSRSQPTTRDTSSNDAREDIEAVRPTSIDAQDTKTADTRPSVESVQQIDKEKHLNLPAETMDSLYKSASNQPSANTLVGEDRLIGHSEPMRALKKMIGKVARTNAPVWITGESGTGKELIARLVHENSPRADSPFIAINCGAIPSELMESELFGHRKGSFTGAHSDHDGLFKRAEGGTLFLDEVAELPLHMQVKLLRAIQERTVRPVGSAEEINTDVRILSASHKDLAIEVDEGQFRHDLYYRLNVICIKAPSLRQRHGDVVLIARHVLKGIARKDPLSTNTQLTPEAEETLSNYAFPGNVRELENILERAVALSDSGSIAPADLNIDIGSTQHGTLTNDMSGVVAANDTDERQMIVDALTRTRWNRKAAAAELGMTYRQLRYRIQQYGIETSGRNISGT